MNYADNVNIIKGIYDQIGLKKRFEIDNNYLETAFNEINGVWADNLNDIKEVNFLMIAEAPLWGKDKKYIYNPETNNSQFFYRNDLGEILGKEIRDKLNFIKICNEIGLLVIDISPFPLNSKDTGINYRKNENGSIKLTRKQYKDLVSKTITTYFEKKVTAIKSKKSNNIIVFFRYARVKSAFQKMISKVLIDNGMIRSENDIGDISKSGGNIDKTKLAQIINRFVK